MHIDDVVKMTGVSKRNIEIDIMKGIGILLVMIGHATWKPVWIGVFIASFHMPLFFLISGYYAKTSEDVALTGGVIRKNFKQLIIPYIAVACVSCVYIFFQSLCHHDMNIFVHTLIRYGLAMDTIYNDTLIDRYVGPMWFLLALFWGRLFFFYLSKTGSLLLPLCVLLSSVMILLHPIFANAIWNWTGIASIGIYRVRLDI